MRQATIAYVEIVGTPSDPDNPISTLRWRLSFTLEPTRTVRIELESRAMSPQAETTRLFISARTSPPSMGVDGSTSVRVLPGLCTFTLEELLSLVVVRKARDCYNLNSQGRGHLAWCLVVIGDLQECLWVHTATVVNLQHYFQAWFSASQGHARRMSWPEAVGQFYTPLKTQEPDGASTLNNFHC